VLVGLALVVLVALLRKRDVAAIEASADAEPVPAV